MKKIVLNFLILVAGNFVVAQNNPLGLSLIRYFRSDHLPYARLGIPAIMYTSLLHPDYHTPQDNAQNINYPKLKKMADWMYRTGWKAANAEKRPAIDKSFKLER